MHIFVGFLNAGDGSLEAERNTQMLNVREVVEAVFTDVYSQERFLDFCASIQIFELDIGH